MSRTLLAAAIRGGDDYFTGQQARIAAARVQAAIVQALKKSGRFTLPRFGSLVVRKTPARKALNPRTGAPIRVRAGKTVRFRPSPKLRAAL